MILLKYSNHYFVFENKEEIREAMMRVPEPRNAVELLEEYFAGNDFKAEFSRQIVGEGESRLKMSTIVTNPVMKDITENLKTKYRGKRLSEQILEELYASVGVDIYDYDLIQFSKDPIKHLVREMSQNDRVFSEDLVNQLKAHAKVELSEDEVAKRLPFKKHPVYNHGNRFFFNNNSPYTFILNSYIEEVLGDSYDYFMSLSDDELIFFERKLFVNAGEIEKASSSLEVMKKYLDSFSMLMKEEQIIALQGEIEKCNEEVSKLGIEKSELERKISNKLDYIADRANQKTIDYKWARSEVTRFNGQERIRREKRMSEIALPWLLAEGVLTELESWI